MRRHAHGRCANGFHHMGEDDCGCLPTLLADPPPWLNLPGRESPHA